MHFETRQMIDWLIEWFKHFQQYFIHIMPTTHIIMSFLGFISNSLGLWSVLPKDTPMKNPEDPVRLEHMPRDYKTNTLPLTMLDPWQIKSNPNIKDLKNDGFFFIPVPHNLN